ncbi:translocation/assembly module TamB domain-containing protein [Echinicola shivajiensis]|uniref:translocation/assembly module TamB domain-containing protein n=1 Tax=Echinicola shivajiensis TaxID=1035916 RepID=UPI001BFC5642|nr:translocation/assembly module TamB domain-containing protein [Echinicola shivajiensis]
MEKKSKIILMVLGAMLIILSLGYFWFLSFLEKNGVSYSAFDFDYPSSIEIQGLKVGGSDLDLEINELKFDWEWKELSKGNFKGNDFFVKGARMIYSSPSIEKDDEPSSIIPFLIQNLQLQNVEFIYLDRQDSINWLIPELLLSGFEFDGEFKADTLLNRGSKLFLSFNNPTSDTTENGDHSFGGEGLFDIDHLGIEEGTIECFYKEQTYTLSDLTISMEDFKGMDLWAAKLSQLNLTYQDSLDVALSLNDFYVNNQREGKLADLKFELPGLSLQVDEFGYSSLNRPHAIVTLGESQVAVSWIQFFLPEASLPLAGETMIKFEGKMGYSKEQAILDGLFISISEKTNLKLSGEYFADTQRVSIDQFNFFTSLYDLSEIGGFEIPDGQKNINISTDLKIQGANPKYIVTGDIGLDQHLINVQTQFNEIDDGSFLIKLGMNSGPISLEKLLTLMSTQVYSGGFQLLGNIEIKNSEVTDLVLNWESDTLNIENYGFESPWLKISYGNNLSSLNLGYGQDKLELFMETKGLPLDFSNFNYGGFISGEIPLFSEPQQLAGRYYSKFQGEFSNRAEAMGMGLSMDSLTFQPAALDTFYMSESELIFQKEKYGGIDFSFLVNGKERIKFLGTEELVSWWSDSSRWEQPLPDFKFSFSSALDSIFIRHLTGFSGTSLLIENLDLQSQDGYSSGSVSSTLLGYNDFNIEGLNAQVNLEDQNFDGNLLINSIDAQAIRLDSVVAKISHEEPDFYRVNLGTSLPGLNDRASLGLELANHPEGVLLRFQDTVGIQLGSQKWIPEINEGIYFLTGEGKNSNLSIINQDQKIAYHSLGEDLDFEISALKLAPLFSSFFPELILEGILNAKVNYTSSNDRLDFTISGEELQYDSLDLGELRLNGFSTLEEVKMAMDYQSDFGKVFVDAENVSNKDIKKYDLRVEQFDFALISSLFPDLKNELELSGYLNGQIHKEIGGENQSAKGYFILDDLEFNYFPFGFYAGLKRDSILLDRNELMFDSFALMDREGNTLSLDGKLGLGLNSFFDLKLSGNNFNIVDQHQEGELKGKLKLNSDLKISGPYKQLAISGSLRTLPGGNVHYTYEGAVELESKGDEVIFMSFDEVVAEEKKKVSKPKAKNTIDWNVDVVIGKTNLYLLINVTSQDYAQLDAEGELYLRKGEGQMPAITGEIFSSGGSVFYDAPMVSDLNLNVIDASVKWLGDYSVPYFTFHGSEIFRIIVNKDIIDESKNNTRIPVTVLASVENRTMDDFDIQFDLESSDPDLGNYLGNLPVETRKSYAINLLLFGNLESDFSGGSSSYMESLVSTLNELTRKNIKNADLSFYIDSEDEHTNTSKIGYSFSKGIFNEKLKITLGGDIGFGADDPENANRFNPLGNIQLNYILSEKPDISIRAAREDVYRGAIDGLVNESSMGVSFQKRYPNLFKKFNKAFDQ